VSSSGAVPGVCPYTLGGLEAWIKATQLASLSPAYFLAAAATVSSLIFFSLRLSLMLNAGGCNGAGDPGLA
jgi:hypothetical protein